MHQIAEWINQLIHFSIDQINYFWVMLLMTIESSFVPFPSEAVIPPAAYKAFEGNMSIYLVWLFATLGSLWGALLNYYLAKFLGRKIVYAFAESRVGRLMMLSREKIDKAEAYFIEKGSISTLIGRLIPWVRQIISVPAGLAGMDMKKFILFTVLGSGLWNAVLCALGYLLASQLPREQLAAGVMRYAGWIGGAITLSVALFLLYKYLQYRHKKAGATKEVK